MKHTTNEEKIQMLMKVRQHYQGNYFEINALRGQFSSTVCNILYANRNSNQNLDIKGNLVRFPFNPDYSAMIDKYLEVSRQYAKQHKDKRKNDKQIKIEIPSTSLSSELRQLREKYGEQEFDNEVSALMSRAGYEGSLVKKKVLQIGL
jgi:hypothetical protein